MSRQEEWRHAYAKQAKADWDAYERLLPWQDVPQCHKLHFLQMACEKFVKAYLCKNAADPSAIQASHKYIAANLPTIAKQYFVEVTGKRPAKHDFRMGLIRQLAREIEFLVPSLDDDGKRPDNCEYPWEDAAGRVHVPAEHSFTNVTLLTQPVGRTLLKVVREGISRLL
jgi:hypothetical protein